MASTYKTPGVYVEEISKFPPSIAAVETAIPAFIGYTEKATKDIDGDLIKKPTKISAIADYARYFGGPFYETTFSAEVTDKLDLNSGLLIRPVSVARPETFSPFMMYYSIRMYFANGGGPCYIISVDTYKNEGGTLNSIDIDLLGNNSSGNGGLDLLKMEDEPTLIVFPDAQALSESNFYSLFQAALAQCNELQDRFALIDTKGDAEDAPTLIRNNIGTDYLKYGAIYYPFIETVLNYAYKKEDVLIKHTLLPIYYLPTEVKNNINAESGIITESVTNIEGIDVAASVGIVTSAANKTDKRTALEDNLVPDLNGIITELTNADSALKAILADATELVDSINDPDVIAASEVFDPNLISDIINGINGYIEDAQSVIDDENALTNAEINTLAENSEATFNGIPSILNNLSDTLIPNLVKAIEGNDITTLITGVNTSVSNVQSANQTIVDIDEEDDNALAANKVSVLAQTGIITTELNNISGITENVTEIQFLRLNFVDLSKLKSKIAEHAIVFGGNINPDGFRTEYLKLQVTISTLIGSLIKIQDNVNYLDLDGKNLKEIENIDNESYNQIITELAKIRIKLPPSSIMAGIYARVDRDRGVWKAPANVSLSSVIGPTRKITNDDQDGLNVDTVAGKSINVIRSFTGKGTMVWGARTLAGNDNEWRYVSVRRFFNFVEESTKKGTSQFVFEPNDANTWVKVKAMIENFLTLQWRAGALAGAKAEHAFYVKVGLGETMTALDILEGRMIVEIGLAVVRPAEFIILRFSHKMQES